uniref:Uncharacterized protein n=1 Tax=Magallana gigas TaxID=29159 RepID=K1PFT0_MAGGI
MQPLQLMILPRLASDLTGDRGFHLVSSYASWSAAKSGCESNNMKLASLPNLDAHNAASQFINVKRAIAYVAFV